MKKILAGLLCVCLLCGMLVGCEAKVPPMTLPHNENVRLDMTRDEIANTTDIVPYLDMTDWYTETAEASFLNAKWNAMYMFIDDDTLRSFSLYKRSLDDDYMKLYKQTLKYIETTYGVDIHAGTKSTTYKDEYEEHENTSWTFLGTNSVKYTVSLDRTVYREEDVEDSGAKYTITFWLFLYIPEIDDKS